MRVCRSAIGGASSNSTCQSGEGGAYCGEDDNCLSGQCNFDYVCTNRPFIEGNLVNPEGDTQWGSLDETPESIVSTMQPTLTTADIAQLQTAGIYVATEFGDTAECPAGRGVSAFCGSGMNKNCMPYGSSWSELVVAGHLVCNIEVALDSSQTGAKQPRHPPHCTRPHTL